MRKQKKSTFQRITNLVVWIMLLTLLTGLVIGACANFL